MRRCPTILAVLSAVLIPVVASSPASAGGISPNHTADYYLVAPSGGIPNPGADVKHLSPGVTLPQVQATVSQPGGVIDPIVPPTLEGGGTASPLTILSDSHGFNQNSLSVGLLNDTSTTPTQQKFGLVFFNSGLAPGGLLHFALDLDNSLTTPPTLTAPAGSGYSFVQGDPPSTTTTPSTTPTTPDGPKAVNTPEPLSVILWSVLAGLGLVRARALRRSRPASS